MNFVILHIYTRLSLFCRYFNFLPYKEISTIFEIFITFTFTIYVQCVKQSHYRPGVTQRVPGS